MEVVPPPPIHRGPDLDLELKPRTASPPAIATPWTTMVVNNPTTRSARRPTQSPPAPNPLKLPSCHQSNGTPQRAFMSKPVG